MSKRTKQVPFGKPKYIPSSKEEQEEYPPIKTDVSSVSLAELSQDKTKLDRPLVFDKKVLMSLAGE
jgi:hypothetical protein